MHLSQQAVDDIFDCCERARYPLTLDDEYYFHAEQNNSWKGGWMDVGYFSLIF